MRIEIDLTPEEALAYAQFLKRVDPEDYERRAGDQSEANYMLTAGWKIRDALTAKGVAPR